MDKIKVFNDYFDSFCGFGFRTTESDNEYYTTAIERLTRELNEGLTPEELNEVVSEIVFWAIHKYGSYTFRTDEPIMDVEPEQLPINMTPDKFNRFKEAIEIVVEHYQNISRELGRISPISMNDFEPLLNRTVKFTMNIPAIWLNT